MLPDLSKTRVFLGHHLTKVFQILHDYKLFGGSDDADVFG